MSFDCLQTDVQSAGELAWDQGQQKMSNGFQSVTRIAAEELTIALGCRAAAASVEASGAYLGFGGWNACPAPWVNVAYAWSREPKFS